jgi:membrane protease YdiL (CAAX protease family)
VVVLAASAVLFITVGAFTQEVLNLAFGLWFTELFAFMGIAFCILQISGRAPAPYARMGPPPLLAMGTGFLFGLINYFAFVVPLQGFALKLAPTWLRDLVPDSGQIFARQGPVELAFILGAVSLAAPVCEELVFRGVVQQGMFPKRPGRWPAIFITAALFSLFHMDPIGFGARFELGLLFGWLFERSGSLWPNVCAHSANNVITTMLYLATRGSPEEGDVPARELLLMGFAGLFAFLGGLALVRQYPKLLASQPVARPVLQPPRSVWPTVRPWLLWAGLSISLLFAVDHRGIRLNAIDLEYPLTGPEPASLQRLRDRVRAGKAPMDDYTHLRRTLARRPSPRGS